MNRKYKTPNDHLDPKTGNLIAKKRNSRNDEHTAPGEKSE